MSFTYKQNKLLNKTQDGKNYTKIMAVFRDLLGDGPLKPTGHKISIGLLISNQLRDNSRKSLPLLKKCNAILENEIMGLVKEFSICGAPMWPELLAYMFVRLYHCVISP
jgi:hypothetical protein